MSTQGTAKPAFRQADFNEEQQVADYLKKQPDFFERHSELLAHMTLPHATGGAAVSLVERQTGIMRQRNEKLEKRLRELIGIAKTNQQLSDKTHTLSIKLLEAKTIPEALTALETSLREDFGSERAAMVLFMADDASKEIKASYFMRRIAREDASLKPFITFMDGNKPRCGQIRDAQKDFLFGPDNTEVGSAALLPIGEQAELGMLAIGNQDAHHFHPAMSTDFLVRLCESVSAAVNRFRHDLV